MPLYRCTTAPDVLDDEQRRSIAEAITDIHCDATGAPPTFVHVQFLDATGDEPTPVVLHGGIRTGRDDDTTTEIIRRCTESVSRIGGVAADHISMRTSSAPANWIFEGGRVFPDPGDEEAWLASSA